MNVSSTLNELPPSMTAVSVHPSPPRKHSPSTSAKVALTLLPIGHCHISFYFFHYTCHYLKLSYACICWFIIFCLPRRLRVYLKLGFLVDSEGCSSSIITSERKGEAAGLDTKNVTTGFRANDMEVLEGILPQSMRQ